MPALGPARRKSKSKMRIRKRKKSKSTMRIRKRKKSTKRSKRRMP
jgi:hypothetical protein